MQRNIVNLVQQQASASADAMIESTGRHLSLDITMKHF